MERNRKLFMDTTKKRRLWLIIPLLLVTCAIGGLVAIFSLNEYSLVLSIPEETVFIEYGTNTLPEVTALCKGTILKKEGVL